MNELLDDLLATDLTEDEKDIFKPHGPEGLRRMKQDFELKDEEEQEGILYSLLMGMDPNKLIPFAFADIGIDVECIIKALREQFNTRKLRTELYSLVLDYSVQNDNKKH